ncbi:MAG: SulP family inorganic anion transporter [Cytophagales bacterium]|nr:MAG: SulP family inorganic anion transporter [Cytophagales bacterium]
MNTQSLPKEGIAGLRENWQKDVLSGFFIFLIALPLSLGIAMASGMPPMAGIIAAVVGGTIVSMLAGSYVTINGPAAGLIVVMLGAVETLGAGDAMAGYKFTLAATVVSGGFIVLFGILKAGVLGDFFPTSAVHGLLASIGIIIISKQLHVMVGVSPVAKAPIPLLMEVPHSLLTMNPQIAIIGFTSLGILILFNSSYIKRFKVMKMIPAPMVVVLVGIILGHIFDLEHEHTYLLLDTHEYTIGPKFLVTLPANVLDGIVFPDFAKIGNYHFWMSVLTITLVQSLETIMSAKAVEQLDPYKRHANLNKDLRAIGIGNIISGGLGGLPMIAEIVRSSANIANGARTVWANFSHGAFMLLFVVFAPQLIHQIPLAALGAMLVFTGFRLASPKEFKIVYKIGSSQLMIFVFTIIMTLATDLLIGIFSGIALKLAIHLYYGAPLSSLFRPTVSVRHDDADTYHIYVAKSAIFTNYIAFKQFIQRIPKGKHIILDFSGAEIVDHTVLEHLHHLSEEYEEVGGKFDLVGLDNLTPLSGHPLAMRVASANVKTAILNERQQRIAEIAQKQGFTFSPQKVLFDSKLKSLPFFMTKQFKYEENMLHKNLDESHIQISDIHAREGDQIGVRFYNFTALLITDMPAKIPQFSIERESFTDKMLAKAGFKDIDFDEHKQFSDMFLLHGTNEAQIRAFFDVNLMDMMVGYPNYHVESDGSSILIHKGMKFLDIKDLEELMQLGEMWRNYIIQQRVTSL